MNYVFGTCFTCGRVTARRFLRVKKLMIEETAVSNKILVCGVCEKKLQLPKGIENWGSPTL
jgi:uncharacterized CHY-type Zn-finger protein